MDYFTLLFLAILAAVIYIGVMSPEKRAELRTKALQRLDALKKKLPRAVSPSPAGKNSSKVKPHPLVEKTAGLRDSRIGRFLTHGLMRWIALGVVVVVTVAVSVSANLIATENARIALGHANDLRAFTTTIANEDRLRALKQADEDAVEILEGMIAGGMARYDVSASYGVPASRAELLELIETLKTLLEAYPSDDAKPGEFSALVEEARLALDGKIQLVGTLEQAIEKRWSALAAELKLSNPSFQDAQVYCTNLEASAGSGNVRDIAIAMFNGIAGWSNYWADDELASDVQAAVQAICPKFEEGRIFALRIFGTGSHVVGGDIQPGTYVTNGGVTDCYWERRTGGGTIIDNFFGTAYDRVTVTIRAGEGFESDRCGIWIPIR